MVQLKPWLRVMGCPVRQPERWRSGDDRAPHPSRVNAAGRIGRSSRLAPACRSGQSILRAMGDPGRLNRGDWEAVLHAPFHVYSAVASIDGKPLEAQFRRLGDEIASGGGVFAEGTIGRTMIDALAENMEPLWAGYQASARPVKDGLTRATKALRQGADDEVVAIRRWLR